MKTTFNIFDVADEYLLDVIETTPNGNGYPENIHKALVGFDSFEDAQDVANKYGLRITTFTKRQGNRLWTRNENTTYHPLRITADDYGSDFKAYGTYNARYYFDDEVKPCLNDFDSIDELESFIQEQREIIDALDNIDDEQLIIIHDHKLYDRIDTNMMEWSHDGKNYIIGVI